jgi:hypothetical protein
MNLNIEEKRDPKIRTTTEADSPTNDLLARIRSAEGQFDDVCPFAEKVSFQAIKLYVCSLQKKCDYQISYGTRRNYCEKELNR